MVTTVEFTRCNTIAVPHRERKRAWCGPALTPPTRAQLSHTGRESGFIPLIGFLTMLVLALTSMTPYIPVTKEYPRTVEKGQEHLLAYYTISWSFAQLHRPLWKLCRSGLVADITSTWLPIAVANSQHDSTFLHFNANRSTLFCQKVPHFFLIFLCGVCCVLSKKHDIEKNKKLPGLPELKSLFKPKTETYTHQISQTKIMCLRKLLTKEISEASIKQNWLLTSAVTTTILTSLCTSD